MIYVLIILISFLLLFVWCALKVSSNCSLEEEKEIEKGPQK